MAAETQEDEAADVYYSFCDKVGQYTVALKVDKTLTDKTSTAIIYTSANAFTSDINTVVNGVNLKLFGNTLNSLADLDVKMITIPSKPVSASLTISAQNARLIIVLCLLSVLAILASGIVIWNVRRKK